MQRSISALAALDTFAHMTAIPSDGSRTLGATVSLAIKEPQAEQADRPAESSFNDSRRRPLRRQILEISLGPFALLKCTEDVLGS